jgi:hypothetical protein
LALTLFTSMRHCSICRLAAFRTDLGGANVALRQILHHIMATGAASVPVAKFGPVKRLRSWPASDTGGTLGGDSGSQIDDRLYHRILDAGIV